VPTVDRYVTPLTNTSLSADERRVLERFVEALRGELGDDLCSVWLYGSRARGEPPHPGSDVDVLVIIRQSDWFQDVGRVNGVLWAAAQAEDVEPYRFSAHVGDIEWVEGRRAIRSFFIQEVDRDKIVLEGDE